MADGPKGFWALRFVRVEPGGDLCPAAEAEAGEDGVNVILHGGRADPEGAGDLLVRVPLCQEPRDLSLAGRKACRCCRPRPGDDDRGPDFAGGFKIDIHAVARFGEPRERWHGHPWHCARTARGGKSGERRLHPAGDICVQLLQTEVSR